MNNFGLGLVGAGLEGGFLLSPLVVDTVEQTGLRLRAIYDSNQFDAKEVELVIESKYDQINIPQDIYLTNDLQHMFEDFMLDVMLVAMPAAERRSVIEAALSGFDRVAVLSPLAESLEDAQAIVEASHARPILLNLPRRFEAGWQKAHELLSSGVIGDLQFINLRAFLPETNYLRLWQRTQTGRDELFMGQLCGYMDVFHWFAGAACVQLSAMGDPGSHDLDHYDPNGIFNRLFKKLPVSWRSLVSARTEGVEVDDFPADEYIDRMAVQMRFSNDVFGTLAISSHGPAASDGEDLELVGTKGRIWLDAAAGTLHVHFWDGSASERLDDLGETHLLLSDRLNAAFLAQMPDFILGVAPAASAMEGYEALKLALAALDSMNSNGSPVLMDLELDEELLADVEPVLEVQPEADLFEEQPVEEPSVAIETAPAESEPEIETEELIENYLDETESEVRQEEALDNAEFSTEDDWDDDHPAVETIDENAEPDDADAVEEDAEAAESRMSDWPEPLDEAADETSDEEDVDADDDEEDWGEDW